MLNLRSIDLNLLPVFEAVHEERNLSRAAERLGMSQSAVSHALTRLRDLLHDDLFVRLPQGVQATPLADLVYLRVRDSLAGVRDILGETRMFNPVTSTRRFYVEIPHPLGPLLAESVHRQLAETAPGVSVEFSTRAVPVDLLRRLQDGKVDMAIDWIHPPGEGFHTQQMFFDRLVLVARQDHPALLAESFDCIARNCKFVVTRNRQDIAENQVVPKQLKNLPFEKMLVMSEQLEVLLTVSRTDYVGIIPLSLVRLAMESFALVVLPKTPPSPDFPVSLIWQGRRDADPAHTFVREQLLSAIRQVAAAELLHSSPSGK